MSASPQGLVDIDGVAQSVVDAKISVFDRGFLYGDAAFEVLRTYSGRPFCLREHLERLWRSCARLRIEPPLSRSELEGRIDRAIDRSGLGDCYLRVVVTRGRGAIGLDIDGALEPSVLVYALPLKLPPAAHYEQGVAVGLVRVSRPTDGTAAAGAKTSNYLSSVLALDEVRRRGCQEALIVGPDDRIVEGATSNVFAVIGGAVVTPPASAGILEGITRRVVLDLCEGAGLACEQRPLPVRELLSADELFITSSIRELVPVVCVETDPIGDGNPGPVFQKLLAAYRARARR